MYQYTEEQIVSMKKVEATRASRLGAELRRMTAEEKDEVLASFHPDYIASAYEELKVGPNKGRRVLHELAALLQGRPRVSGQKVDLTHPDYDVDVLVIGGGGAGASAAIEADNCGANVMIVTKLRLGDANTAMAEGGIQAADKENDSPAIHYLDALGGGHFKNKPELLYKLVTEAPEAIQWLNNLGVMFDKAPDGTMITTHGGGTSRKRMHACRDYSGSEIMRVLRDEVLNRGITVVDFTSAIELIKDKEGKAAGAVLQNMETGEILVARAKTVILATGGAGRLHYQGFPTSNHYGATADGLVLAYRAGAKLLYPETLQYHPTGAAAPTQIYGALVTEKVRSLGAQLVNREGVAFVNPLETRDVTASAIIRECKQNGGGVRTTDGEGVWLDTPLIEMINGEGTIEKRIPAMLRMFGQVRHRYPQGAHSRLSHAALSERRDRYFRQRDVGRGKPLRRGRSGRGNPRHQPSDGQFAAGYHRIRAECGQTGGRKEQERATQDTDARFRQGVREGAEGGGDPPRNAFPEAAARLQKKG